MNQSFELARGMARLHLDPSFRTMLLDEGIKPVFRVSNLDSERTAEELKRYRDMGYFAAPCHEAFQIDERGLYDFTGQGSLFYLFVTKTQERLDEMLAVDRLQKTADVDATKEHSASEIGRLLGYPPCCSAHYASFTINPHQQTFLLRTWQATRGVVSPALHPTLRPLGHFPCCLNCAETERAHLRILDAMERLLPETHAWVAPAMNYPVLFLDRGATIFAGSGSSSEVAYERAWHIGEPSTDAGRSLREHLDEGDRAVVEGPWIRVYKDGALLADHDTRSHTLVPLLLEVDDQPVGKCVSHVAIPALNELARYLAGDLLHVGHRASYVKEPSGPTDTWANAMKDHGVDTMVLTADAPDLVEAATAVGITVVGAGVPGDVSLPTDRHAFAHGFERFSRGRDCGPIDAPVLSGRNLAHRHLMWPAQLLEDVIEDKRHQVVSHRLQSQPDASDRVERLAEQIRAHAATGGSIVVVGSEDLDVLPALLGAADDAVLLQLEAPLDPGDFRKLAGTGRLRQPPPQVGLDESLEVLAGLRDSPFAEVESDGSGVVLARPAAGSDARISVWMEGDRWKFEVSRPLTGDERRWLRALRALLSRAEVEHTL